MLFDLFEYQKNIKVLEVINSLKIGGAELLLRNFVIECIKQDMMSEY